jgi:hypothetical protein
MSTRAMATSRSTAAPPELVNRVRRWRRRMTLEHWQISVFTKSPLRLHGERVSAYTQWTRDYQTGWITFDLDIYNELNTEERDHLVCHELTHLIYAREDDTLSKYIGRSEVYSAWSSANEATCDIVAGIIVRAYQKKTAQKQKV